MPRHHRFIAVLVFVTSCGGTSPAVAQLVGPPPIASGVERRIESVLERRPETVRTELFAGADQVGDAWFIYNGITQALFSGITQNGWRLRLMGGYGRYQYDGYLPVEGEARGLEIKGTQFAAEALLGYQQKFGPATAKLFAGASAITHSLAPLDLRNQRLGERYGGKVAAELWVDIGERAFASTDLWWSSNYDEFGAQVRGGWRFTRWISIGLEARYVVDDEDDRDRLGLFAGLASRFGDLQISGGVSDHFSSRQKKTYLSIGYQVRY